MRTLRCNPGGTLSPEETMGRETFITHLWRVLERQSVYINDLRRIGKTQIMLAMRAKPPSHWQSAHCDLEGFHHADEFVSGLYDLTFKHLDAWRKLKRKSTQVIDEARGAEFDGVKLQGSKATWKTQIQNLFAELNESLEHNEKTKAGALFVFFWDEFPYMLDNIARRAGAQQAMEILDCVRKLEAANSNIRLVLTGSIGLHHVLKELQQQGYHNSPLNRFSHEQPGPLPPEAAVELAQALLLGEQLNCEGASARHAQLIARSVGYVGFYIHKLIARLPSRAVISTELIETTLRNEIAKLDGDWDLAHYRQRLEKYYGAQAAVALCVLDAVASTQPIGFAQIQRELSGQLTGVSQDQLTAVLRLLVQDHYLISNAGGYWFYLDLIRAWWRIERQLEAPVAQRSDANTGASA
jgi:hypothetical protein